MVTQFKVLNSNSEHVWEFFRTALAMKLEMDGVVQALGFEILALKLRGNLDDVQEISTFNGQDQCSKLKYC